MNSTVIKPTIGRRVWFRPSAAFLASNPILTQFNPEQPMDAGIVYVHHDHMVNLIVTDHVGKTLAVPSVPLLAGHYVADEDTDVYCCCEWMPYQKSQAAKTEVADKGIVLEPKYREPTQREQLEYALVSGAASAVAISPGNARQVVDGINVVLNMLYPIAATPTSGPDNTHAAAVLYPAIERAMGELSKLHEGFNMEVNRAFNILHDAFWSECPAPASAVPKRRETADAEHRPKPHSLEREIQAKAGNGPRVTPADIEANIASEHYFTAADGFIGQQAIKTIEDAWDIEAPAPLQLLTFCVLLLKNGAKVVGINYGAIDPAQHSAEIGHQKARAQAVDKVYELLGFRLRDELARPVLTDADAAADLVGTPRPDNPTAEAADFLASAKACDLSGDAPCEACQ